MCKYISTRLLVTYTKCQNCRRYKKCISQVVRLKQTCAVRKYSKPYLKKPRSKVETLDGKSFLGLYVGGPTDLHTQLLRSSMGRN